VATPVSSHDFLSTVGKESGSCVVMARNI